MALVLVFSLPVYIIGADTAGQLDVRDYGAKCDGITDDTASIQRAIDAASNSKHALYLPSGTCVISPPTVDYVFKLGSDLALQGDGSSSILKLRDNAGIFTTIFGPYGGRADNLSFSNFTVDYNSPAGDVVSLGHPRFVVGTGRGSKGMIWDRVTVRDISSINAIYSGSQNTKITNCRFEMDTKNRRYRDHSTLYVAAEGGQILDNTFVGGVDIPGSVTAIETHGGGQTVSRNTISGYFIGMNITGISDIQSEKVVVSNNNISDTYHGIAIWSKTYRSHTAGPGISAVTIDGNSIRVAQTKWAKDAVTGANVLGNPSGITIEPTSNLPLVGLFINHNRVEFDREVSAEAPISASSGMGIGYWDATESNRALNVKITDNSVINAPASGIRWAATADSVEVSKNKVVNPGSAANPALVPGYRAAIVISPKNAIPHVLVSDNEITSSSVPGMSYGILVIGDSCVVAEGNTVSSLGGASAGYLQYIHSGKTSCPAVVHGVQLAPPLQSSMLPATGIAEGSEVSDSSGVTWRYSGTKWIASH